VLLSRQDGIRASLRALKEGLPFYYLPDMDFGRRDAVFVPFFGVKTATITAPARLAKIAGALIVPCVTRMTADGYDVQLYPAWEDFPGDDLIAATSRMNTFIEDRVREMPEQYLWTHKRFKTRPPREASFYEKNPPPSEYRG
jgi:KDO2-lipid IV(A) lauroyltransferase